jgi:hypothetical protein
MLNAMKSWAAIATCAALATTGCASGASMSVAAIHPAPGATASAVLTEYVQKLPAGTVVRVVREEGGSVRGTRRKATTESLFLQPATRRPEPIVEIPLAGVLSVTPQPREGNHVGRAIGAGAAAGAGAALAVFLVIVAAFGD